MPVQLFCLTLAVLLFCPNAQAAKWTLGAPSSVVLATTPGTVRELSGVSYLGPSPTSGLERFVAVQDELGKLVAIDVELSPTGQLLSATAVASWALADNLDFEGAAMADPARNSIFLSDENNPGVREYDLGSGNRLQTLAIPPVFTNRRTNRGFESLTRTPDGSALWTANEGALTVDGALATSASGSLVRLLKFDLLQNNAVASAQFAYSVEKIHGSSSLGSPQSGLSDLVALPDGTLLALERSVAVTSPVYLSRVFELDMTDATDVSVAPWDAGLAGKSPTLVAKELLWSGAAGGGAGQNLEGLALGPRLDNGAWVVLGVVDDGGAEDTLSDNTIVAFQLTANPSADFDEDGDVDGGDFLAWQRGFDAQGGGLFSLGDADRDGVVGNADLTLWATNGLASSISGQVPEPQGWALGGLAFLALQRSRCKCRTGSSPAILAGER